MKALPILALLACTTSAFAAPQFSTIYAFEGDQDGQLPGALTAGPDGALYGTTSGGGTKDQGTVFKLSPPAVPGAAWTKETLYAFKPTQSGRPYSRVIFDQHTGALLGVASGQEGGQHMGTVFRLVPPSSGAGAWAYTTIHDFTGGSDGQAPYAELTQDPKTGTIYGTSEGDPFGGSDLGTVFAFAPDKSHTTWTRTLNYAFAGADGSHPSSGLALGANGFLYGGTFAGGVGFGTIFSLELATGSLTTLFQPQSDSQRYIFSGGPPVLSGDGATMYGTSPSGDQTNCETDRLFVCGAAISMPTDGSSAPTVLKNLVGKNTAYPNSGAIWNRAHTTLYVSTFFGLPNICRFQERHFGCGTVFKLVARNGTWKYKLLHAFDHADGQNLGELAIGRDGTLYGVTANGGAGRAGTVFEIETP